MIRRAAKVAATATGIRERRLRRSPSSSGGAGVGARAPTGVVRRLADVRDRSVRRVTMCRRDIRGADRLKLLALLKEVDQGLLDGVLP